STGLFAEASGVAESDRTNRAINRSQGRLGCCRVECPPALPQAFVQRVDDFGSDYGTGRDSPITAGAGVVARGIRKHSRDLVGVIERPDGPSQLGEERKGRRI